MKINGYKLLSLHSAWETGVSYKAMCEKDNKQVEFIIFKRSCFDKHHWQKLQKFLHKLVLLEHPLVQKIYDVHLDEHPAYVVSDWPQGVILEETSFDNFTIGNKLSLIEKLASALRAAHRLGIVHEKLCPKAVRVSVERITIDFLFPWKISPQKTSSSQNPKASDTQIPNMPLDVYSLGLLLLWVLTGDDLKSSTVVESLQKTDVAQQFPCERTFHSVSALLHRMLTEKVEERPSIHYVENKIQEIIRMAENSLEDSIAETVVFSEKDIEDATRKIPQQLSAKRVLGRFLIQEKLGEGGMSVVYKAQDLKDSSIVAFKILSPRWAENPDSLRRFYKEARLLSEVNNPYVANLLEINEDEGTHFLVMEFVAGKSVESALRKHRKFSEEFAIAIIADVSRALLEAHHRGIVHRDIKPANILLLSSQVDTPEMRQQIRNFTENRIYAKLSDFGLARHVIESESLNLTQSGAILGTPLYMSPEQCSGGTVDPRADVYSMGATLFHLLAGVPPYLADNALALLAMHQSAEIPLVRKNNPKVSESIEKVIAKCLAKNPEDRYQDAQEFLQQLQKVLRGEPLEINSHPNIPKEELKNATSFVMTWELESFPAQLWPYVSDTERINKALGFAAVKYYYFDDPEKGRRLFASGEGEEDWRWEEHPYEWLEERRFGVFREYRRGNFKWLTNIVELRNQGRKTLLKHTITIYFRNTIGKILFSAYFHLSLKKGFDRVYRQIDRFISSPDKPYDPFELPKEIPTDSQKTLDNVMGKLQKRSIDSDLLQKLREYILRASDKDIARIRPLSLAKKLQVDSHQLVVACLYGASEGLFQVLWDILCPICKIPSELKDTLKSLQDHGHCPACNIEFKLDFANSVEMILRTHPNIREGELRTYCLGGPAHSPHILGQAKLQPGERFYFNLALKEGEYLVCCPQLQEQVEFEISPQATMKNWDILIASNIDCVPMNLKPDSQEITITNNNQQDIVVRIERAVSRKDALTAAKVAAIPLFRKLFPNEILSGDQCVNVSNITLLATHLEQTEKLYQNQNDQEIFDYIYAHFQHLEKCIEEQNGAIVKTLEEGVLAVFNETQQAVQCAFNIADTFVKSQNISLNMAIHCGPAMVATINGRLDYFGGTVKTMRQLLSLCKGGELVLSDSIATQPNIAKVVQNHGIQGEIFQVDFPGQKDHYVLRAPLNG